MPYIYFYSIHFVLASYTPPHPIKYFCNISCNINDRIRLLPILSKFSQISITAQH